MKIDQVERQTEAPIHDFIYGRRERAMCDFDRTHHVAINNVIADIGRTHSVLILVTVHGAQLFPGSRFDGFALLNRALESLASSLSLSRQRATVDAMALLRLAMESACVAVHVTGDSEAYMQWLGRNRQKYDSGSAISFARSRIPRVAELWGGLSQKAIHPNQSVYGPERRADGSLKIVLGSRESRPMEELNGLLMISVAALIVLRASELVLFEPDITRPGWLQLPGTSWQVSEVAEATLEKRFGELSERTAK